MGLEWKLRVLIVEGCGGWWLKVLGIDEVDVGLVPLVTGCFRGLHTHLATWASWCEGWIVDGLWKGVVVAVVVVSLKT